MSEGAGHTTQPVRLVLRRRQQQQLLAHAVRPISITIVRGPPPPHMVDELAGIHLPSDSDWELAGGTATAEAHASYVRSVA